MPDPAPSAAALEAARRFDATLTRGMRPDVLAEFVKLLDAFDAQAVEAAVTAETNRILGLIQAEHLSERQRRPLTLDILSGAQP